MSVTKLAISLPSDVAERIEAARSESGKSRSAFVREAVVAYLDEQKARAEAEAYRRGYELYPETEDEEGVWAQLGLEALAREPWDDTDEPLTEETAETPENTR